MTRYPERKLVSPALSSSGKRVSLPRAGTKSYPLVWPDGRAPTGSEICGEVVYEIDHSRGVAVIIDVRK